MLSTLVSYKMSRSSIAFLLLTVISVDLGLVGGKDECFSNADCYSDFRHLRIVCSKNSRDSDRICRTVIVVARVNVVSITNVTIPKIVHDVTVVPTALIPRSAVSELTEMSVGEIVSEKGARRLAIVQVLENTATRVTYVQI